MTFADRKILARPICFTHVTFAHELEEVDESLFGIPVDIRVVVYGNDGVNEGVKVELFLESGRIMEMAEKLPFLISHCRSARREKR